MCDIKYIITMEKMSIILFLLTKIPLKLELYLVMIVIRSVFA